MISQQPYKPLHFGFGPPESLFRMITMAGDSIMSSSVKFFHSGKIIFHCLAPALRGKDFRIGAKA